MTDSSLNNDRQLEDQWLKLLSRLKPLNEILTAELESCWRDLQNLLSGQIELLKAAAQPEMPETSLAVFRTARAEAGRKLLIEPMSQWERRRPYRRALAALESYDRSLEELILSLPETIETKGTQAQALLGNLVNSGFARRMAGLRRKKRRLPFSEIIADETGRMAAQRAETEGEFLLVLAQAVQQLRRNWEVRRAAIDATAQAEGSTERQAEAINQAEANYQEYKRQASDCLMKWKEWLAATEHRLARRILAGAVWRRKIKNRNYAGLRTDCLTHWGEQMRSLESEIRFERDLQKAEDRILSVTERSLQSLAQERANLLAELDGFNQWLRQRISGAGQSDVPPPPKIELVPAASRLAELSSEFRAALQTLPQVVRIRTKLSALPRRQMRTKELHPAETAFEAFERSGRAAISNILQAIEAEHQRIVREIEQAREVVNFGLHVDSEEQRDPQIAGEALHNALSLLEFHRQEATQDLHVPDALLARKMAAVFSENRLILRRNRIGALAYLGQQGVQQALATISRNAIAVSKQAITQTLSRSKELVRKFLVYIGWLPETATGVSEVVRRPFLPQEFTADLSAKDLPAIYRRLFRFEAVRDPRFLVGREREMEAVAETRAMWEAGRPVALLIIGERGSGKTSLINCAIKRPLEGLEIVRGEFHQRLSNAAQLRDFLAETLGLEDSSLLEKSLNQHRRVVILEELERSFLRQIGHYAAMRELQRLIAATCRNTLWIVVTNQIAFRFLDASVSLGQSFSHRVNAASAAPDALRDAILLRHNLSGLRLQFSIPAEKRTLLNRWRNWIRGQADPEKIFFDQLAQESAGVFRTAFEIWLGQIESAQAGAMSMKPLTTPDLTPVIAALDTDDLFTLVAVLQHGSLTPDEHATIFQKNLSASQAQIDELLAREIIEQDPNRIGFRVRPEALRVVKEALYRRNLL